MLEKINYLCSALKLQVKYNCMSKTLVSAEEDINDELFLNEYTYPGDEFYRFRAGEYDCEEVKKF